MKAKFAQFYKGPCGEQRLRALQRVLETKILVRRRPTDKILVWTSLPGLVSDTHLCPFADNQRPPYGNGALDRLIIIHCFDVTKEPEGLMAEAARLVRDHGLIDVIGWTKPVYDHHLPIWARGRQRIALRFIDFWSLKWRRYEKVQDLLTLTFDSSKKENKKTVPAASMPVARNVVSDR